MKKASLRELFDRPEMTLVPGAGSPLDVLLVEQLGFDAAYISGYCVAAQRFGVPDIGLIAFKEMRETVETICDVSSLPVIVDCDTGYGDVLNVRHAVRAFESAGAAAVQIEDQTWPKRCGHMQAKTVESVDVLVRKVDAAINARQRDELVVIARTDAREILGFEEALRRCRVYKSAGADVVVMHGLQSVEELRIFASEIPGTHFVSIGEGECTDECSVEQLHALGYQIAILPSSPLRISLFAVRNFLAHVKEKREVGLFSEEMLALDKTSELLGVDRLRKFESNVRKKSMQKRSDDVK